MEQKNRTIDEFIDSLTTLPYSHCYAGDGCLLPNHRSLNCSTILSRLIQEAARWCRTYSSDLFIWWQSIMDDIQYETLPDCDTEMKYVFGFTESGILNASQVMVKYDAHNKAAFRAVWKLSVFVTVSDERKKVRFELCEVGR